MPADEAELVDARGLKCPLPVLKAEKRLGAMAPGARLVVLATDPMARVDIPLFCRRHNYICAEDREGDVLKFTIVKSAAPAP